MVKETVIVSYHSLYVNNSINADYKCYSKGQLIIIIIIYSIQNLKATFSVRWMTFLNFSYQITYESIGYSKSFMITISPTCLFIGKTFTFVGLSVWPSGVFSWETNSPQITHANHMTKMINHFPKTIICP